MAFEKIGLNIIMVNMAMAMAMAMVTAMDMVMAMDTVRITIKNDADF